MFASSSLLLQPLSSGLTDGTVNNEGCLISRKMASVYGGRHHKAWHTNIPMAKVPTWKSPLSFLSEILDNPVPQTLGYGLTDSPVGLLAWIYEKLVVWTDNYNWSDDEVLTWISMYWFSRAGPAASLRIYFELREDCEEIGRDPTIPIGASFFPKELIVLPAAWLRKSNNVVFESRHKTGGHFAATERPEELIQDVRKMFAKGALHSQLSPEELDMLEQRAFTGYLRRYNIRGTRVVGDVS
ncbi:Alpha/Beta hydrolase protein [Suillus spraguei]|nr:Alpha/Beta hydrolase protein [Suillus spraguei]